MTESERNGEIRAALLLDGFVERGETVIQLSSGSVALGASFNPLSAALAASLAFTIPVSGAGELPGWELAMSTEGRALLVSATSGPMRDETSGESQDGVYFEEGDPSSAVIDLSVPSPVTLTTSRGEGLIILRSGSSLKLVRCERHQEAPSLRALLAVEDPDLGRQISSRLDATVSWEQMIAIGTFLRFSPSAEKTAAVEKRLTAIDSARWDSLELESTAMTWVITSAEEALEENLEPPLDERWRDQLEYLTTHRDELESIFKVLSMVGHGDGLAALLRSLDRRIQFLMATIPPETGRLALADPWLSHIERTYGVRWFSSPEG